MWHRTGANFTSLDLLLEIIHRDIHPEVAIEVDDDGIDTTHGIEDSTQPVVVGNLSRELLALKAQLLTHEAIAKLTPVVLGICYMVSVEITCCTTKLSSHRRLFQTAQLLFQTIDIYHHLLTQTCGRGWLSMSLGEHGDVLPLLSIIV